MLDKLHVGISSWIIQDGNYPDFEVGRGYEFALEFGLMEVRSMFPSASKSLRYVEAAVYEFEGELVFRREDVAVLDVGVLCFRERPSKRLDIEGRWFSGQIYIGVDPFFYKESLHKMTGIPSLTYAWALDEIQLETTPWRMDLVDGRRFHSRRDDVPHSFRSVQRTDAWNDDDGHGHYVFSCTLKGPVG